MLPNAKSVSHIGGQLLRSGTSVGANYRAACRARSRADMIAKLGIVEEEADESAYWLEILIEKNVVKHVLVESLHRDADAIVAMTAASIKTLRGHSQSNNAAQPTSSRQATSPNNPTMRQAPINPKSKT